MAIRPDSEPKSASPRSGAPKGELEQYGVWVKAEPQDVIEEVAVPGAGESEFELPVDSISLSEESFLSEDEEKLLGSFDSEFEIPSESTAGEPSRLPDIEDIGPGNIYISLRDSENARSDPTIHPGVEIDMDSVVGLSSPLYTEDDTSGSIEDISFDAMELTEEPGSAVSNAGTSISASLNSSEADLTSVTEFDDFLSKESMESPSSVESFDDVSAVERELSAPAIETSTAARPHNEAERGDMSSEILLKIAKELSSIRGELVSLKAQIGEILVSAEPAAAKAAESSIEEVEDESPSGGFFDDEEDETIALTDDELDNILNTADFTEEVAQTEESVNLEFESSVPIQPSIESNTLLDETLLPESGDYQAQEADSLSLVSEEGVMPLTEAPEDTSYLEDAQSMDLGAPMSDAPLVADESRVEHDLSDFDLEGEPEDIEPRLEIIEELPLASFETDSGLEFKADPLPAPKAKDLTLDIDVGPGYEAEESVVEAEFLEPIPEIEEPNFAEINLHEEKVDTRSFSEPSDLEEIEFLPDADLSAVSMPPPIARPPTRLEEEEDLILAAEEEDELPSLPAAAKNEPPHESSEPKAKAPQSADSDDGEKFRSEIKTVLSYLDKLLDSLPEAKIEEFARSEHFDTYKKLFEELGLV